MSVSSFLMLLASWSVISGLIVEAIKKLVNKDEQPYNVIALVVALIVGTAGTLIYYQLNGIPFNTNNIIYAILLGLASGVSSMVGYDKVKQAIDQITKK